jgi:uncharacterized protein (DUF58 family)
VVLGVLGIIPAVLSLWSPLFLAVLFAWNLLLAIGFAIDALSVARRAHVSVERILNAHLTHGVADRVTLRIRSALVAHARLLDEPAAFLVPKDRVELPLPVRLIAGGVAEVVYEIVPRRRGKGEFGAVNILAEGPLRLAMRRIPVEPDGVREVHVYPRLDDFEKSTLNPELMMAELGIKRVRRRSEGTELESLRDAVLDDELRKIDWRATARRGKLTAKNYELEKNHEVVLCLDTGRLMGALLGSDLSEVTETKLDCAIGAAIRLAAVAIRSGDRVGVMSFGRKPGAFVRPDKGRAQIGRLLEAVHDLSAETADPSFFRALSEVRLRQKKRALIVFLTDFVDQAASREMLEALAILAKKHAVLFVALRDPHIRALADAPISDLSGAYRSIAAMSLEEARAEVIESLSAQGVRALDLTPDAVSSGAISAYLALRSAERL